jgi:hypothetical protein
MTVERLLDEITSAELTEWMAFLQLEQQRDEPDVTEAWKKAFKANG